MNPSALSAYAGLCGWTLARAHARSGDAAAIASYLGTSDKFDRSMASFAERTPTRTSGTTRRLSTRLTPGRSEPRAAEVACLHDRQSINLLGLTRQQGTQLRRDFTRPG